jgi:glycosyltransferase involved in cell wall biosynthesis
MRVLFVVNTFPPGYTGGAEVANYHTCRALIRRGIDCSILVLNNRTSEVADNWYELDGIPVHRVTHRILRLALTDVFDWRFYRVVTAELRRLRPDLVHMHNVSGATLAPYLACRAFRIPVVNTLHDLWLLCPNNMLYRKDGAFCDPRQSPRGCRACFRRYDYWGAVPYRRRVFAALTSNVKLFVSPSQAVIDRHTEAGYPARRFRLVRLGFEAPTVTARDVVGLESVAATAAGHSTLVFAGGGTDIKGAKVLLEALPALLRRVERLQVIVAGGGDKDILMQLRRHAPAVQVLGALPFQAMPALFALADLTIVASVWHENAPVVVYESFQAGTPVVGSDFGGIPELIHVGETGYLFPVGDADALTETIVTHLTQSAMERRRMRQHCVEEVRTRLTLENHIAGITEVYREVVAA